VCSTTATVAYKTFLWDWRTSSNAGSGAGIRIGEIIAESALQHVSTAHME